MSLNRVSLYFIYTFADAAAEERDPENFDPTRNLRGKSLLYIPVDTY